MRAYHPGTRWPSTGNWSEVEENTVKSSGSPENLKLSLITVAVPGGRLRNVGTCKMHSSDLLLGSVVHDSRSTLTSLVLWRSRWRLQLSSLLKLNKKNEKAGGSMALLLLSACALLSTFPSIHGGGSLSPEPVAFSPQTALLGATLAMPTLLLRVVVYFDENKAHSDIKNPYCWCVAKTTEQNLSIAFQKYVYCL